MQNLILAGSLSVMVALESTAIKFVKTRQVSDIPSEQLVLLVEITKLIVSWLILRLHYYIDKRKRLSRISQEIVVDEDAPLITNQSGDLTVDPLEIKQSSNIVWFLLPAAMYAVSNNVTFAALSLMTPALFNLLMNLKIPFTAFMAWFFLSYKVTSWLLISFITLFIGSAIATIKWNADGQIEIEGTFYGLLLMVIYSSLSASGAVYTEYLTKMRFPKESTYIQNIKFCACSAIANIILMTIRGQVPYIHMEAIHLLSVLALAMNGLVTSAVLKFGGSILKTYAASVAMFLSAFLTWLIFHQTLRWNFYFGAGISAVSVNLYAWEKMRKR